MLQYYTCMQYTVRHKIIHTKMNLSTVQWAQWDKTQSRELLGLFICVCSSLCTIIAHNTAQNRPDKFSLLPPGQSPLLRWCLFEGKGEMVLGRISRGWHTDNPGGRHSIWTNQQSTSINPPILCGMPFLLQPSQFFLAWNRHRYMLDWIPHHTVVLITPYSSLQCSSEWVVS